ncbi:hypothetical protein L3X38_011788 [Prunus dulcis]|uniref:Endonuclease/exonuclease/phosphatase domain-containing protein n=1 Tax=Prunus dulcis TaxID=3755 RepID=A0AAD4ZEM4_PRUDU|nr:hypothetical protein L3X38_011788 [Prunus dulcis]
MLVFSWNVRGLGNRRMFRVLKSFLQDKRPYVIFLTEKRHIDVRVTVATSESLRVTGFYCHPDQTQRHHSWELLRHLGRMGIGPWLCCGDFNEVMECHEKSKSRLRSATQMEDFKQATVSPIYNLENCASDLMCWSARKFGQVPKKVKELRGRLANLQWEEPSSQTFHTRNLVETELDKCLEQEKIYLQQRSRVNWLRYGDHNTSFFHKQATSRRKTNALVGILDVHHRWQQDNDQIGGVFVEFFTGLFKSDARATDVEIFNAVQARVSSRSYQNLLLSYSKYEIERVLKSIGPSKAPSPEGMPALFCQRYWDIVG